MAGNSRRTPRDVLFYLLPALAVILILALVFWALVQHGTDGFLRVTQIARYAFILAGVLAIGLALLTLFHWLRRSRRRPAGHRPISAVVTAISAVFIVLFAVVWLVLAGFPGADVKTAVPFQPPVGQAAGSAIHFAVGSDAHFGAGDNNPTATAEMLAQIRDPANRYDQFFFLGDLVQYGFIDRQWQTALTAFSSTTATLPVHFAPGNHDTLFAGFEHYLAYCTARPFSLQRPGDLPDSPLWYRVDAGKAHFLVLDLEWSAESYSTAQAAWLEDQLRTLPQSDWKIVMSHGFYYGSGVVVEGWKWYDNPETISRLTPLFEKYGVDLVFSGHNHDLEFLQHGGVYYAVCGAFGGEPDPLRTYVSPASLWYKGGQLAFVDVSLDGDQAALNFRAPDSTVLRNFTFTKSN